MNKEKKTSNKGKGFYCTLVAMVASIAGCVLYNMSRENVSSLVVLLLIVAAVGCAVVALIPIPLAEFIPFGCIVASTGIVGYILLNNISEIWFKNNVAGLSITFIASIVCIAVALIASFGAAICKQRVNN